jgi:hypothetical protein
MSAVYEVVNQLAGPAVPASALETLSPQVRALALEEV